MTPPVEDRHFRAFCASGDPADLARVFDATAPKLLQVAVHLTGEIQASEDLVQATFLSAIEGADRYRVTAPVLSWLLGILANHARHARRQNQRRIDPDRLCEQASSDPSAAAESRELAAAFKATIDELPDQYAQVLVLHLTHGLTAKEIARALRRPAGTVRTQIVRAMELVRKSLPAGFTVGTAVTATAGHSLAAVRAAVLAHVPVAVPTMVGVATAGTLLGVVLMKKTLIVAAAACVALVGFYSIPSSEPAPTGTSGESQPNTAEVEEPKGVTDTAEEVVEERELITKALETPADGEGGVRLQCVWASDGAPVPWLLVRISRYEGKKRTTIRRNEESDAEGTLKSPSLAAGRYSFWARGGEAFVDVEAGRIVNARLSIKAAAIVSGRVVDELQRNVEGASIDVFDRWNRPRVAATTGVDGRFRIRMASAGQVRARKVGWQPSAAKSVSPARKVTTTIEDVVLVLPKGGHRLTGIVLDPLGHPAPGATVAVVIGDPSNRGPGAHPPITLRADAAGRFETGDVPPGKRVVFGHLEGFAFGQTDTDVPRTDAKDVVVQLRRGATVYGVLRDKDDQPVVGTYMQTHRERRLVGLRVEMSDRFVRRSTLSNAAGRYRMVGIPPGRTWVAAMVNPMPKNKNAMLKDGEEFEWNPNLGPPGTKSIRGVLVGPDGEKLANWKVSTSCTNLVTMMIEDASAKTDEQGKFEVRDLRDTPYRVIVNAPGPEPSYTLPVMALREGVRPGRPEFVWRIPFRPEDAGSIVGKVLGLKDRAMNSPWIVARNDGVSRRNTVVMDAEGGFRLDNVPPGNCWVVGYSREYGWFDLGRHTLAAKAKLDIGAHRLPDRGHALVKILLNGKPPTGVSLQLEQAEGVQNKTKKFEAVDGALRSDPLPPGRYKLTVRGADIAPSKHPVTISPGTDVTVEVRAMRAATVAVEFTPQDLQGKKWRDTLHIKLSNAQDEEMFEYRVGVRDAPSHTFEVGLPPGKYSIEGSSSSLAYRRGRTTFVVPESGTKRVEVRVALVVQK